MTTIYRKNCNPNEIKKEQLNRDINELPLKNTLTTIVNNGFDCDKGVFIFRGTYDKIMYDLTSLSDSKNIFVLAQKQDV